MDMMTMLEMTACLLSLAMIKISTIKIFSIVLSCPCNISLTA